MSKLIKLVILLTTLVLSVTVLTAQETYDFEWLKSIVVENDYEDQLLLAFTKAKENGWTHEGNGGVTIAIPANSVVITDTMTGIGPSFTQEIEGKTYEGFWFTASGGRFSADSYFRAFQLNGVVSTASGNINDVIQQIQEETDYAEQIEALDTMWSFGNGVLNRWGSSGPREVLTEEQINLLVENDMPLQPVEQLLPGNTIIWGELFVPDSGAIHWGLVRLDENVYLATCDGGYFVTIAGYRAMQLETPAENYRIPDGDGCLGQYSVFDEDNIRSISPLSD